MSWPKSAAVKDIDIDIADILIQKCRYRIDIGKGDIDPPPVLTHALLNGVISHALQYFSQTFFNDTERRAACLRQLRATAEIFVNPNFHMTVHRRILN